MKPHSSFRSPELGECALTHIQLLEAGLCGSKIRAKVGEGSWGTIKKSHHILVLCATWDRFEPDSNAPFYSKSPQIANLW